MMIFPDAMVWQHFTQLSQIRNLPLHEQTQRYNYYLMEQQALMAQIMAQTNAVGGGGNSTPSFSGDLILVFSDFATVDLFLTNGVENLADWNDRLVQTGDPYTSISVDEATYTVYLSGGSNVVLKDNVFNGDIEGGNGLGNDLLQVQDNGTIIEVGNISFGNADNLTIVELPEVTTIGTYAFYNGTKLQYVNLPNVTSIGEFAFYGAFNTATSPITLNIPSCLSFGPNWITQEADGLYFGTTEVDSPKVMTVTASGTIQFTGQPEWTYFLSENTGVIPNYV
jgi:hypothetical protein